MQVLRLSTRRKIILDTAVPLGVGGEALVFRVQGEASLVAKIYHQPTAERAAKLRAMLANPPEDPAAAQGHVSIAWPVDLLQTPDHSGQVVGFLMPFVGGMSPLIDFYHPRTRRQKQPLFNYQYLLTTARNLASAVAALHARNYVIGDVNESNVLAAPSTLVTLVDTDSFQVPDNGTLHRCPVGKLEFTPPELQGKVFLNVDRRPEHDAFGLAVLLFQLLQEGTHPFDGVFTGTGEPELLEARIAAGHFPHGKQRSPYRSKPLAPSFGLLPPELRGLFQQCFEQGHSAPAKRPEARAWHLALKNAALELATCRANEQHRYGRHLDDCPWCERAARLGNDPFPSKEDVAQGRHLRMPAARPAKPGPVPTAAPTPAPVSRPPPTKPARGPKPVRRLAVAFALAAALILSVFAYRQYQAKAGARTIPALASVLPAPATFATGQRWTNTLGIVFAGVPGVPAFSVWETRVADYAAYAAARSGVNGSWQNPGFTQGGQHPVVNVSWQDAQAFCTWLTEKERGEGKLGTNQSYRLPADWEWSVAVGLTESQTGTPKTKNGETPGVFPWGMAWPPPSEAGNYSSSLKVDSFDNTAPVGSFKPNQFGLYDLGGNVWEWCEDWYDSGQKWRVLRGGSWDPDVSAGLSSSCRNYYPPDDRYYFLGFRCVLVGGMSPQEQAEAQAKAKALAEAQLKASAEAEAKAKALAAVTPAPANLTSGQRWTNTLGMVFAGVPGVPAFSIWETRVADYAAYAAARTGVDDSWKNPGFTQTDQHPVVNVSWQDAQAFCAWLTEKERGEGKLGTNQSYRLPADWEWSVAVGLTESQNGTPKDKDGKTPGVYPWGKQWPPPKGAGNYDPSLSVDSYANTSPVGSFTANSFGLYDLGGNVWEWCEDWYDSDQKYRGLRGGSWNGNVPAYLSSAYRYYYPPDTRYISYGFRCVVGVVGSAPR